MLIPIPKIMKIYHIIIHASHYIKEIIQTFKKQISQPEQSHKLADVRKWRGFIM